MTRANIFQAIYELAAAAPGLVRYERRLKIFTRYRPEDQPVLNFYHGPEIASPMKGGGPIKWAFHPELVIYVWDGDENLNPDDQVCNILDYITRVFSPQFPGHKQTLGGLVDEINIEGTIKVDEVADIPQIVITVPLCVLVGF